MKKEQLYISTIASDDAETAGQYGLGLEIAEFCTAWQIDNEFTGTDAAVRQKLQGIPRRLLHGPFNELFPCAIDPKARELAKERYRQALGLTQDYGCTKLILHGGYNPYLYYPCWYTEQSVPFWKEFLEEVPDGITVCLENVLEEEPDMLVDIVKAVQDPRLRLCLDIGHLHAYSKRPWVDWLRVCAPYLSHFHIHNNDGSRDSHSPLNEGCLPIPELLETASGLCPDATFTLELMEAKPSVQWLRQQQILED